MNLYRFVFIIILPFLVSCQYDYDFGEVFTPSIVIASTITPDSTIKVYLHWSKHVDDTLSYKKVERFSAKVSEDSKIVFDGEGVNGLLSTTLHPKEGSQYRLEIEVPDYGKVSAETSIPSLPKVESEYTGFAALPALEGSRPMLYQYHYFSIDKIEPSTNTRSVMVRAMGLYKEREPVLPWSYYATNSFCDQFNAVQDSDETLLKGSSVGYENYIRVPSKNIEQAMPLKFSIQSFGSYSEAIFIGNDDFGYPMYEYKEEQCTHIVVEVIAPSDEYDRFHKSAHLQKQAQVFNYMPLFNGTVFVHSNIENGLGIFMGYSSASQTYEIKSDE